MACRAPLSRPTLWYFFACSFLALGKVWSVVKFSGYLCVMNRYRMLRLTRLIFSVEEANAASVVVKETLPCDRVFLTCPGPKS